MLTTPEKFSAFISSSATVGHCYEYITSLAINEQIKPLLSNKVLFIHYGTNDHLSHVIDFLPKFAELLNSVLGDYLSIKTVKIQGGQHVPPNGVLDGLKYIYDYSK